MSRDVAFEGVCEVSCSYAGGGICPQPATWRQVTPSSERALCTDHKRRSERRAADLIRVGYLRFELLDAPTSEGGDENGSLAASLGGRNSPDQPGAGDREHPSDGPAPGKAAEG